MILVFQFFPFLAGQIYDLSRRYSLRFAIECQNCIVFVLTTLIYKVIVFHLSNTRQKILLVHPCIDNCQDLLCFYPLGSCLGLDFEFFGIEQGQVKLGRINPNNPNQIVSNITPKMGFRFCPLQSIFQLLPNQWLRIWIGSLRSNVLRKT